MPSKPPNWFARRFFAEAPPKTPVALSQLDFFLAVSLHAQSAID